MPFLLKDSFQLTTSYVLARTFSKTLLSQAQSILVKRIRNRSILQIWISNLIGSATIWCTIGRPTLELTGGRS